MTPSEAEETVAALQESEQTTVAELQEWAHGFAAERQVRIEEGSEEAGTVLRVHLPDIDPEHDVDLVVEGGMLRLRGILHDPPAHRVEIRHGAFEEWLRLPGGATAADIRATYADGVLEIGLPPGEPTPPERIRVTGTPKEPDSLPD